MDYRFVDAGGKEISKSEGKKILALLGFDDVVEVVQGAHSMEIAAVLGEIASLSRRTDRLLHVSYRFDRESGNWFASVEDVRADFKIEMFFEQRQSRDGLPYWEATFKLPFEWHPALMLVNAAFARLNEKVGDLGDLMMEVEQLKGLYRDVEETLEKLTGSSPKGLRRLRDLVNQLSRLAKALEEIEEEEEEEEEEW
jgi:hypothetical protein